MLRPSPLTTPQQTQSPGDAISQAVGKIVEGALSSARAGVREKLDAAREHRAALESQLGSARSGSARRDIQRQLDNVNTEIAKLQSAEAQLGGQSTEREAPRPAAAPGTPTVGTPPPLRGDPFDRFNPAPMVISIMAILFIGFPLALTFARLIWRRATHAPPPAMNAETGRRFDRIEQSVDAIAIEVERISENQRYLTKLLAESKQGALKE